jgi:hypothetical protein
MLAQNYIFIDLDFETTDLFFCSSNSCWSGFGGLLVSILASGTFGGLLVNILASGTFGGLLVNILASGTFGGLLVNILASGTQDRGFAPGQSSQIFRAKKSSACLPSEGK